MQFQHRQCQQQPFSGLNRAVLCVVPLFIMSSRSKSVCSSARVMSALCELFQFTNEFRSKVHKKFTCSAFDDETTKNPFRLL